MVIITIHISKNFKVQGVAPWFNKRIDDSPTGDSHALLNARH